MSQVPLLEARGVSKIFRSTHLFGNHTETRALDDVSVTIQPGAIIGIVGESGSGKSTLARCILGLEKPTSGEILFEGQDMRTMRRSQRGQIQPIFQNPTSSLNPRRRVGAVIAEPLLIHGNASAAERKAEVARLLGLVALPAEHADRYPSQLSGGQCQRVSIARALALKPKLIVADEATSALDVLIQRQIVDLLADLRRQFGVAMLFVSHNLAVTARLCDEIVVMHRGRIVEAGPAMSLIENPQADYTKVLLSSVPRLGRLPAPAPAPPP
jgi:ABC-type glutathione transport system ATPase component